MVTKPVTYLARWIDWLYGHQVLRVGIILSAHLAPVPLANYLAFWLRFDGDIPPEFQERFIQLLPALLVLRAVAFVASRLHYGLWRYVSISDLKAIVTGVAASSVAFYILVSWIIQASYPRTVIVIDALILILILSGLRMTRRLVREMHGGTGRRVIIIGAGDAGEMIVRELIFGSSSDYHPVGFIDDNRTKIGRYIHGVPVLGTTEDIDGVLEATKAEEVLIAMPAAEPSVVRQLVRKLEPFKVPIKTLPNLRDILEGTVSVKEIRDLAVEDLLARAPVGLDPAPVERLVKSRRVLVTGAGGSIGSELCRQIIKLEPASLVMLDRYENSLHALVVELVDIGFGSGLYAIVGDITDRVRIDEILTKYQPQIVFHAAAHKHVPLMEASPCEAIKNNVRGTRLLAEAAERHNVDTFIMISTDKAVNPTSVMGASKRVAELLIQLRQRGSGTSFATVRFGNVLASNGSVVPRFVEQIRRGGPITVTHPEMRRFFMLIPEAVQLVLHAAAQAENGGTYVLEMGEQVKLVDMARDMIRLSGLVPDEDIAITFVGLRPGEKLYEELVSTGETLSPSSVEKILKVTSTTPVDASWLERAMQLEEAALAGDEGQTTTLLRALVSDYVAESARNQGAASVAAEPPTLDYEYPLACTECGRSGLRRSRARSRYERLRKNWSAKRIFRCEHCGWRGWLMPLDRLLVSAESAKPAVDLSDLDSDQPVSRQIFAPRDLG
jgi:FlaA1/EpsC-like NDP-sugar epimerase